MSEHGPLEFPAGSTLMLQRRTGAAPSRYGGGEDAYADHHTIGPCSVLQSSTGSRGEHQSTPSHTATIGAPTGSDVKVGDRIVLPSGTVAKVTALPIPNSNPWTGWTPRIRVVVEAVRWA
ncbi:head-to-tail stopper [Gordonia phage Morgana]|uniref:Head-to-tail stopper n=1 Tax=Gordonia phage Morgana TaxID=3137292 RepID=A0AAX4RAI8_9CAUD